MSEEIKKEEEINLDEKLDELLKDSSIKSEEEKTFLKDVGDSLKKGEVPIDLISIKSNEAISKLESLKQQHPEFESFVNHYKNKINEGMAQAIEMMNNLKKDA